MAHILPPQPPTKLPKETLKVFEALKALPDRYFIWHHLAPWDPLSPDFLILTYEGQALLVKVCPTTISEASSSLQMRLFGESVLPIGKKETEILEGFIEKINLPQGFNIGALIIFPNLPNTRVQEIYQTVLPNSVSWSGKEVLEENEDAWKPFFSKNPLPAFLIEKIRQCFSPEIVVPSSMTVRPEIQRRVEAGLTEYLLDYDQEKAVKSDLDLSKKICRCFQIFG